MEKDIKIDKAISDIFGVFTDPIIVWPGGWGDSPPPWIREAITLERLTEEMKAAKGEGATGTDAEASWYISSRSLEAPLDSDWVRIYMYSFTRVMRRHGRGEVPADLVVDELDDYSMGKYLHLKRWLYNQRVKLRQERDRADRREKKEAEAEQKAMAQPALFEF